MTEEKKAENKTVDADELQKRISQIEKRIGQEQNQVNGLRNELVKRENGLQQLIGALAALRDLKNVN